MPPCGARPRALSDVSVESEECNEREADCAGAAGALGGGAGSGGAGQPLLLFQQQVPADAEEQRQVVRAVMEQHGDPTNRFDRFKVLEEAMLNSERDICIFAGAIELLRQQLADATRNGSCSVCARAFQCAQDYENCVEQLDIKIRETETARSESNVVEVHNSTKSALQSMSKCGGGSLSAEKMFESRVSFNMRSGSLTELRNQKVECLQDQRCFACLRDLRGTEVVSYLQRVDRNALHMQERLHVHY
jgi:hypothetical protein